MHGCRGSVSKYWVCIGCSVRFGIFWYGIARMGSTVSDLESESLIGVKVGGSSSMESESESLESGLNGL
jgi:hypothetical protein